MARDKASVYACGAFSSSLMRLANLSLTIIRGSGALRLVLTIIHLFAFSYWRSTMLGSYCLGFEVPAFWRAKGRLVVTSLGEVIHWKRCLARYPYSYFGLVYYVLQFSVCFGCDLRPDVTRYVGWQ